MTGCASWQRVEVNESWALYGARGATVDAARYGQALEPAFEAVEEHMGSFERTVRVHALDEDVPVKSAPGSGEVQHVPGIGPARVRAFHVRSGGNPFTTEGVFLGTTEVGTVVHELVHARLAEHPERLPLWFEEGLASLLGDGTLHAGEWTVDGLACWPLRELREQDIDDQELARLLAHRAHAGQDARDNLLVHFVGWAIVFDLSREFPHGTWRTWLERFERGAAREGELAHARRRLDRTLAGDTESSWLARLDSPDPAVRLAAARGTWKLRSRPAVDRLLESLEDEADPEVRYGLALNAFLSATEMRVGRSRWRLLQRRAMPVLRRPELEDAAETAAARDFFSSVFGRRRGRSQEVLGRLARFWEE